MELRQYSGALHKVVATLGSVIGEYEQAIDDAASDGNFDSASEVAAH